MFSSAILFQFCLAFRACGRLYIALLRAEDARRAAFRYGPVDLALIFRRLSLRSWQIGNDRAKLKVIDRCPS